MKPPRRRRRRAAAAVAAGATPRAVDRRRVPIAALEAAAGAGVAVVRAMPNTPALVGAGRLGDRRRAGGRATTTSTGPSAILGAVGIVVRVAERQLDAVTGLSGSGPAYVFLVAEALSTPACRRAAPAAGVER